ncbi:MAG TPA: DUF222 domain-containing protein [Acidimicrobiales bacterium]|jgi:hypothetical protein|nr:DUF222 domain-containing protein [Acidimicrobiales bacterium]
MYDALAAIEVTPAAAAAGTAMAVWANADPAGLTVEQLAAELGLVERVRGQLDAVAVRHALALRAQAPHTAVRVNATLGLSGREQRRRAKVLDAARTVPGAVDVLAAGAINIEHLETLGSVARKLDDTKRATLLADAQTMGPDEYRIHASLTAMRASQDDGASDAVRRHARRNASFADGRDGMQVFRAELPPEDMEVVRSELHRLMDAAWRAEHPEREPVLADRKPNPQRLADAFLDMANRSKHGTTERGDDETAAARAGNGVDLLVVIDYETLAGRLRGESVCQTEWGTPLAPDTVRRFACEAGIIPVVLSGANEVVNYGRKRRLASAAQRRAVIARDKHCIACDLPPRFCRVHHIDDWTAGGRTDLARLALLCHHHHGLVHEGDMHVELHPDGTYHLHPNRAGP